MKEVGMKRSVVMTCILLLVAFFLAGVAAAQEMGKMETATGVVTSVDPQGTAITILWKVANEELDVGTIVTKDTVVVDRQSREVAYLPVGYIPCKRPRQCLG